MLAGAGAGFLLAVLWMDLMFDVQARGDAGRELPPDVRSSIAAYYARVTTRARPMNRLIAVMMVVTVGALVAELVRDDLAAWRASLSLGLAVLGRRVPDAALESSIVRSILRDHLACFAAISAVLVLQLLPA